jgi:hypothetical protein
MKHTHSVDELVSEITKEILDAGKDGYFSSKGGMPDPGLPKGVKPTTDLDDVSGDDPSSDPRRKSPRGKKSEAALSKSQFGQVVEHALSRIPKFGHEKALELQQPTQVEGLAHLIETIGRLEVKLNTVADQVRKLPKK